MKCLRIPRRFSHYSFVFAAFLSAIFSLSLVSSSHAVSDLTVNVDSSSTTPVSICSSGNCSTFKYFFVSCPSVKYNSYFTLSYTIVTPGSSLGGSYRFYPYFSPIFSIPSDSYYSLLSITGISNFSDSSCTLTLSENLPSDIVSPPSGTLNITENGTFDVTNYATAVVDVENEVIYADYHDDLVSINNSIIICAGVLLVLYFFYCIYRILIIVFGSHQK